jgi:hypothetical protein
MVYRTNSTHRLYTKVTLDGLMYDVAPHCWSPDLADLAGWLAGWLAWLQGCQSREAEKRKEKKG